LTPSPPVESRGLQKINLSSLTSRGKSIVSPQNARHRVTSTVHHATIVVLS
jgi:hypothetical protein